MPNAIQLSKNESTDLFKVERIDIQTGNVLVNAVQEPGGPVELAGGTTFDASEIHGKITVTGPGRIKWWLEGEAVPAIEKPKSKRAKPKPKPKPKSKRAKA